MDASTGDAIKTWRFSNMKQWNVNWEIKMVSCNGITGRLLKKLVNVRIKSPISSEDYMYLYLLKYKTRLGIHSPLKLAYFIASPFIKILRT